MEQHRQRQQRRGRDRTWNVLADIRRRHAGVEVGKWQAKQCPRSQMHPELRQV